MWRNLLIAGMFVTIGIVQAPLRAAPVMLEFMQSDATTQGHQASQTIKRRALVIGNADYLAHPLKSASRDADDMSRALTSLGFDVTSHTNLNEADMRRTIDAFIETLGPRDTAFVYFAGHGLQADGDALLAPRDVRENKPAQLLSKGIALRSIVDRMAHGRPDAANVVVLDMCMEAPFGNMNAPTLPPHTLVAFAAAPGAQAFENDRNGRYTSSLLNAFEHEQRASHASFDAAAASLAQSSHGTQRPWIASTLERDMVLGDMTSPLHLASTEDNAAPLRARGILPKDSSEQYELTFWDSIKDSTYPSDYEAYLKAYPNGRFATLAKARIERLHASAAAKPAASAPIAPKAAVVTPPAPVEKPRPAVTASAPSAPAAAAPKPAAKTASGNEIKDCPNCPVLIPITSGSFSMGSNNDDPAEKPPHRVSIAHPFAIGKYEVTIEQWNACVDAGACTRIVPDAESNAAPQANSPMRNVSWDDAQVYVTWLSKVGGKTYRLPTEAEWEYAARGGTQSTYWWGDQMKKGMGDCKDCGDPYRPDAPTPVGSFTPNPYGLYDMNGSVWEWVADCWHGSYKGAPGDGRSWEEASCPARVIRGGSWREGAAYMQSATRFKYSSSVRQSQNGFRVARDQ